MSWGGIAAGAGAIIGGVMSKKGADKAASKGTPKPYGVSGPGGGMRVDPKTGQLQLYQSNSPYQSLFNNMAGAAFGRVNGAPDQFLYGADPEIAEAYKGLFGQGLTNNIQNQYDLLSQIAAPGEQRARVGLDDNLFSKGQLGTTGGAERFRALEEALGMADLQRQKEAVGLGRQEAMDRFVGATGGVQQGMGAQMQNLNVGQSAFGGLQQLFSQMMQQAQLGVGAASGTPPALAMYQAQAGMAPYQAGYNFLQNSGAFDKLGSWLGGLGGGQNTGLLNMDLGSMGINGNFGL